MSVQCRDDDDDDDDEDDDDNDGDDGDDGGVSSGDANSKIVAIKRPTRAQFLYVLCSRDGIRSTGTIVQQVIRDTL